MIKGRSDEHISPPDQVAYTGLCKRHVTDDGMVCVNVNADLVWNSLRPIFV